MLEVHLYNKQILIRYLIDLLSAIPTSTLDSIYLKTFVELVLSDWDFQTSIPASS